MTELWARPGTADSPSQEHPGQAECFGDDREREGEPEEGDSQYHRQPHQREREPTGHGAHGEDERGSVFARQLQREIAEGGSRCVRTEEQLGHEKGAQEGKGTLGLPPGPRQAKPHSHCEAERPDVVDEPLRKAEDAVEDASPSSAGGRGSGGHTSSARLARGARVDIMRHVVRPLPHEGGGCRDGEVG